MVMERSGLCKTRMTKQPSVLGIANGQTGLAKLVYSSCLRTVKLPYSGNCFSISLYYPFFVFTVIYFNHIFYCDGLMCLFTSILLCSLGWLPCFISCGVCLVNVICLLLTCYAIHRLFYCIYSVGSTHSFCIVMLLCISSLHV